MVLDVCVERRHIMKRDWHFETGERGEARTIASRPANRPLLAPPHPLFECVTSACSPRTICKSPLVAAHDI